MDRVTTLLGRFPGPVTLRASRTKWLTLLAASALFTAAGIGQIINGGSSIANWPGVAFFGACTAAAVAILFVPFDLTLDGDGFTMRTGRRSERWRWVEVGDFAVIEPVTRGHRLRRLIGFNDKRPEKSDLKKPDAAMDTTRTGRDYVLVDGSLTSAYGLPFADLVRLMSWWQERAMENGPGGIARRD
jgi:hypothetical protein